MPQSQTAGQPMASWGRGTEHRNNGKIKLNSNALAFITRHLIG